MGANDGAGGTAAVLEIARALRGRQAPGGAPPIRFVLFDGEESPDDSPALLLDAACAARARTRAATRSEIRAVILLDFVAEKGAMRIPREAELAPRAVVAAARGGAQGRGAGGVPGRGRRRGDRRPHAVPAPRRARDRPDRLHVRLLAQDLRRHERGLGPLARPRRARRSRRCS